MDRRTVRARIEEIGIIPALRVSTADDALFAVGAIAESGITIAEITLTVPGAVEVIRELAQRHPDLAVGAGTVFDLDTAKRCLDAGARFLTSPGLDPEIVEFGLKHDVTVFPGVLTPSEITQAVKMGVDFVKIYPCSAVGGAVYLKSLTLPFQHVRMIAAGGVNQQTAADYIGAGAAAVGIGRDLVQPAAIRQRERRWLKELARRFLHLVQEARSGSVG